MKLGISRQNIPTVTVGEVLDRRGEVALLPESKGSSSELVTGYLDLKDQVSHLEMQVSRLKSVNAQLKEKASLSQLEAEEERIASSLKLEALLQRASDAEAKLSSLENTTFNVVNSETGVPDVALRAATALNWELRWLAAVEGTMRGVILEDVPLVYDFYLKKKAPDRSRKLEVTKSRDSILKLFKDLSTFYRTHTSRVDPVLRDILEIVSPGCTKEEKE